MNTPTTPKALNERQVSEAYGMSVSSLQKHRMKRTGPPYVKIGRRCFYLADDLEAYFEQHRIDPTAGPK